MVLTDQAVKILPAVTFWSVEGTGTGRAEVWNRAENVKVARTILQLDIAS